MVRTSDTVLSNITRKSATILMSAAGFSLDHCSPKNNTMSLRLVSAWSCMAYPHTYRVPHCNIPSSATHTRRDISLLTMYRVKWRQQKQLSMHTGKRRTLQTATHGNNPTNCMRYAFTLSNMYQQIDTYKLAPHERIRHKTSPALPSDSARRLGFRF